MSDGYSDRFNSVDFKRHAQEILDCLDVSPIDGDHEVHYDGPEQPGPILRKKTVECLGMLAKDNTHESNELALKILDAIPANHEDEFYEAVVHGASRAGNIFLAVRAESVVSSVQESLDEFRSQLLTMDDQLDEDDLTGYEVGMFSPDNDGGIVFH